VSGTKCEICGVRDALYVCSRCGARVCGLCIDPHTWTCVRCGGEARPPQPAGTPAIPTMLLMAGFILAFLGFILMFIAGALSGGNVGGVIFVWPIPLVFGFGSVDLMAVAVLILLLLLMVFVALPLLAGIGKIVKD